MEYYSLDLMIYQNEDDLWNWKSRSSSLPEKSTKHATLTHKDAWALSPARNNDSSNSAYTKT